MFKNFAFGKHERLSKTSYHPFSIKCTYLHKPYSFAFWTPVIKGSAQGALLSTGIWLRWIIQHIDQYPAYTFLECSVEESPSKTSPLSPMSSLGMYIKRPAAGLIKYNLQIMQFPSQHKVTALDEWNKMW